jgi:hypothetical protein
MNHHSSNYIPRLLALLVLLATLSPQLSAVPMGTAFTYQGRLNDGGNPAQGMYDLRFAIYDVASGGSSVAGPLTNAAVPVSNGLFAVTLDFGAVFGGNARWLEIAVRTNGGGAFATLAPRQPLTPAPYALYAPLAGTSATATTAASANSVAAANVTGTLGLAQLPAGVVTNTQSGVTLTGTFSGDGSALANLNLILTNPVVEMPPGSRMVFTNSGRYSGMSFTPVAYSTNRQYIGFSGASAVDSAITYWPDHGSDSLMRSPELLFTSRGSMAFSCGNLNGGASGSSSRGFQFGIAGAWHNWLYLQGDGTGNTWLAGGNTNLCVTVPFLFNPTYYSNQVLHISGAGVPYDTTTFKPGFVGRATDTNGDGAISFYDKFDTSYDTWGNNTTPRFEVKISPDTARGGININGGITINGATGLTTNYAMMDGNTFCYSNGLLVAIVATPSEWDTDARNYLARINTATNTSLGTNINTFVKALKVDNTWANLMALYTFSGANASTNGQNLISSNYTIAWSGTFGTNDASGIHGNGTDAYGNTTYINASTNGSAFIYIKANANNSGGYLFGVQQDGGFDAKRIGLYDGNATYGTASFSSYETATAWWPTWPSSIMIQRLDKVNIYHYGAGSTIYGVEAKAVTGMPNMTPVYLNAINNQNSAASYAKAHIQGFAATTNVLTGTQYKTLHDAFAALNSALAR